MILKFINLIQHTCANLQFSLLHSSVELCLGPFQGYQFPSGKGLGLDNYHSLCAQHRTWQFWGIEQDYNQRPPLCQLLPLPVTT